MPYTCWLEGCDGHEYGRPGDGATTRDFLRHQRNAHLAVDVPDLNDWHTRAINEVKRLAATGAEWQMWQVFAEIGDPPNYKTENGKFTTELEHLGLAHVVRYGKSGRPGSNGSAVAIWAGGPKPGKEIAAA